MWVDTFLLMNVELVGEEEGEKEVVRWVNEEVEGGVGWEGWLKGWVWLTEAAAPFMFSLLIV